MSAPIPEYTEAQFNAAQALVDAHFGEAVEIQRADSEVKLQPDDAAVTCPVLFWTAQGCNFVVLRTDEAQFKARYFYNPHEQFETTQAAFNTIEDCTQALLHAQVQHERTQLSASNGADNKH